MSDTPLLPPCCTSTDGASLAERLYCAYNAAGPIETAGLNYQGKPCPVWAELPEGVRVKWEAVAGQVKADRETVVKIVEEEFLKRGMDFFGRDPPTSASLNAANAELGIDAHDGIEGVPLRCNCYEGCWEDHSDSWPKLVFKKWSGKVVLYPDGRVKASSPDGSAVFHQSGTERASEAHRLCHQEQEEQEEYSQRVPYGAYVLVDVELRFATHALRDTHAARLRELWTPKT